ncbi:5-formyltetrahydrofolate cyclo-ligase [uncultured Maribacter sp.]|uniref:5-formyltetrahydrofolate cyclo-ligase n=1 Tax=uncultured Maribacter sp. TaxID=431308 RepID=UPI002615294D|nr:5-formyltetrahydrofolate cyclo-ligase [uncultured Maribacter sp.]
MLKRDLRKLFIEKRASISLQSLLNSSLTLSNKLLKLPIWDFNNYHIYLPIEKKKEIDTSFILSILQGKDKNVIIPKVTGSNQLENYLLTDSTRLKTNKWGVPEPIDGFKVAPQDIDVVFVPLLAFDNNGNRIGYGKGYYDTFLKQCKPNVIKVGLSLFPCVETITDVYKGDVPLDYCITPEKTYFFNTP